MTAPVTLFIGLADANRMVQQGNYAGAELKLKECLVFAPQSASVLSALAGVLIAAGRHGEAVPMLEAAIHVDPNASDAWLDLGIINDEYLDNPLAAIDCYQRAIQAKKINPEAFYNLGNSLSRLHRVDQAIQSYQRALALAPSYVDALHNLGNALRSVKKPELAVEAFDKAIKLNSNEPDSYLNRGYALRDQRKFTQAALSFAKAFKLAPTAEGCLGIKLHTEMQLCDWDAWAPGLETLVELVGAGKMVTPPFCGLSLLPSEDLQRKAAEIWISEKHPIRSTAHTVQPHQRTEKLRVGYFSADFYEHPVAQILEGILRAHDRDEFEWIAFSYGQVENDAMRLRLRGLFDEFIDVSQSSDGEIAALAREKRVDVAVDLGGFTADARPGIFSYRAAPIQATYLGYPGTMGAAYFDYLLADEIVIPPQHKAHYVEQVFYLPSMLSCSYDGVELVEPLSRVAYGLPETGFVFCCFNNNWKIDPSSFDSWMRILKGVAGSVLYLYASDATVIANLRKEAKKRGINADRLIFAARVPEKSAHLARYKIADLFLDTFAYNASTTVLDALWSGLPVLTAAGTTFARRVAASVLTELALTDMITESADAFEAKAIQLGNNPTLLAKTRERLKGARSNDRTFDCRPLARDLENAYRTMSETTR